VKVMLWLAVQKRPVVVFVLSNVLFLLYQVLLHFMGVRFHVMFHTPNVRCPSSWVFLFVCCCLASLRVRCGLHHMPFALNVSLLSYAGMDPLPEVRDESRGDLYCRGVSKTGCINADPKRFPPGGYGPPSYHKCTRCKLSCCNPYFQGLARKRGLPLESPHLCENCAPDAAGPGGAGAGASAPAPASPAQTAAPTTHAPVQVSPGPAAPVAVAAAGAGAAAPAPGSRVQVAHRATWAQNQSLIRVALYLSMYAIFYFFPPFSPPLFLFSAVFRQSPFSKVYNQKTRCMEYRNKSSLKGACEAAESMMWAEKGSPLSAAPEALCGQVGLGLAVATTVDNNTVVRTVMKSGTLYNYLHVCLSIHLHLMISSPPPPLPLSPLLTTR